MEYTITITPKENNSIAISSEIAPTRFYEMTHWTLGAAVENYMETEILSVDN